MTYICITVFLCVAMLCGTAIRVVEEIMEQRRRETKTGEFAE